jgi:hypothetical protein
MLDGIVVTHADLDHIGGVLELLQQFPPNKPPKSHNAKFVFNGPLLITKLFTKTRNGKKLIKILVDNNFASKEITTNPSNAGFGSNFDFHFADAEGKCDGLVFNSSKSDLKPPPLMMLSRSIVKTKTHLTVDTSPNNISSIISVWAPTADSSPQVVLTGDAVGYRVLELFKNMTKSVNVFQVPHHGSARNSLPLKKNTLPPRGDVKLANKVLAFRAILAYTFNKPEMSSFLEKELGGEVILNFRKMYGMTLENMMEAIVPAMEKALNDNTAIILPKKAKKTKAEYCYDQAVAAVTQIEKQLSAAKASGNIYDKGIYSLPSGMVTFFKDLYTSTVAKASLPRQAKRFLSQLAVNNNRLFDEIAICQVAQFYSSFQAKVFYISANPRKHGHPHQTLLNGLIQANVSKKNKCVVLLSSGAALRSQHLPDPTTWKEYITFQYLTETGYATIDSSNGTVIDAEEYVPNPTDSVSRKRARDDLTSGSTAEYFRTKVRVRINGSYKVTTTLGNIKYYLSVKSNPEFELQKSEAAVAVTFRREAENILLSISKKYKMSCYIDRLATNADKYCFYNSEDKYLHCTAAGVLTWSEKGASSDSTLLVFDFASAQSGNGTSTLIEQPELLWNLNTPKCSRTLHHVPTSKSLPVQKYLQEMGVSTPPAKVVVKTLLSLLLGPNINDQFANLQGPPPAIQSLLAKILGYILDLETTVTVGTTGGVTSAAIQVNLPDQPPSLMGAPLTGIQWNVKDPESDNVSVKIIFQWSHSSLPPFDLTNFLDLSVRYTSISGYLNGIQYPVSVTNCTFPDIVLLLQDGFATGASAYMALPLALAASVINWKVDNIRSRIKVAYVLGKPLVENATVYADPSTNSIPLGPFKVSFSKLSAIYKAPNIGMTYAGEVSVQSQSSTKQASFQITQDLTRMAVVQFVLSDILMSDFMSFLGAKSSLTGIYIPIVGVVLNSANVIKTGFTLKESVYGSSDMHLERIFFEIGKGKPSNFLPSALQPSNMSVQVSIFRPLDSSPSVGVEASFSTAVRTASQDFQLQSKFSILPVYAAESSSSTGYICTCFLSTTDNSYGSASLGSLLATLGLQNALKSISTSIPVLSSLLDSITLRTVSLVYNSTDVQKVNSFIICVAVPQWHLFGNVSLHQFEVELQFSSESGWSASIGGGVQFGDYLISVELTVPTSTTAGSLAFENPYETLTLSEFMTTMGISSSLPSVPVLGSVLDVSMKSAFLGLETGSNGGLSIYGFDVDMYIESVNMNVFKLSEVSVSLAYNKKAEPDGGSDVSFSITGFINKSVFLEASYDPETTEFTGRMLVATNSTLSVKECVDVLIGQNDLSSQNSVYTDVSAKSCVDIFLKLKYLSANGNVSVKQFSITMTPVLSFGPLVLSQLQLLYKHSHDHGTSTHLADSPSNSILTPGSTLQLLAVIESTKGKFGLEVSFDCNVKSSGTVWTAAIQPSTRRTLSLLSFLSLLGLPSPALPDSGATSKPSSDSWLDLELIKGSLTFQTTPFKMNAFEITTGSYGSGWMLLTDPNITLKNVYLSVSYDTGRMLASMHGSITVGKVNIELSGTKMDDKSSFCLVASVSTDNLMDVVHSVSPVSKQHTSIPTAADLPQTLNGSITHLAVDITSQTTTLEIQSSLDLKKWTVDLGFSQFTANNLHAKLSWGQTDETKNGKSSSSLTQYSFEISAHLDFGDIPVAVKLEVATQGDTLLQATIKSPQDINLAVIADNTLGFAPKTPPKDSPEPFPKLLPKGIAPFKFTTGYLQFNMTRKLCCVYGSLENLGSGLLVAGKIQEKADIGYALSISLSSLTSLLPPLAAIEDIITVKDINASIINLSGLDVSSFVSAIKSMKKNISSKQLPTFPFENLPLMKPDEGIGQTSVVDGTSFCSVLKFGTTSALFSNLESIQETKKMPGDVILYAQIIKKYARVNKESKEESVFKAMAYIPTLKIYGLITFSNINLEYQKVLKNEDTITKKKMNPTVFLTGDILIPDLNLKFHGSLQIGEKAADFTMKGTDQPTKVVNPLGMFGVSLMAPVLSLHYEFEPYSSKYEISGTVNFYSPNSDSKKPAPPPLKLTATCIFINGTPKIVSIMLVLNKPLTIADLVNTIFSVGNWDLLNIGFYSGRIYCSTLKETFQDPTDKFQYQSGYNMSCKTFIFSEDFQFDICMSIPPDKSGFSISGSTVKPLDFGIFKVSTGQKDEHGNFLDKGPTLSCTLLRSQKDLSLEAGITFLDVTIPNSATIKYIPENKEFQFSVTYPDEFLGVKNFSISFAWSKAGGFRIASCSLVNPKLMGMDTAVVDKIKKALSKKKGKCAAIVGVIFKETIETSFNISLSSADKDPGDIFAFQVGGTYDISIVGKVEIASVQMPDIVVHIPQLPQNPTMGDVAKYILDGLIGNAESMAGQLVDQPDHLGKLFLAMSLTKLSETALASLLCRGVKKAVARNGLNNNAKKNESDLEKKEKKFKKFKKDIPRVKPPISGPGFSSYASTVAGMVGAAAAISTIVSGIVKVFNDIKRFFGGGSDPDPYEQKRAQANAEANAARQTLEASLQISGLNIEVSGSSLTATWNALPPTVPGRGYIVSVDVHSPVRPFNIPSQNYTSNTLQLTNDDFYMASGVTVTVIPTCTVTNPTVTFHGPPLLLTHSHTATLPPPENVTISVDGNTCALVGTAGGISTEASGVQIELMGMKTSRDSVNVSSITLSGSGNVPYSFLPSVYNQFSGTGFKVHAQSWSTKKGLQSSTTISSQVVNQAPPLQSVTHTLPSFTGGEDDAIDILWNPPSGTEVKEVTCMIKSSTDEVWMGKVSMPAKENQISLSPTQLESKKGIPTGELQCQATYAPSESNMANSAIVLDSTPFQILPAPTELSVTYKENQLSGNLIISWLPPPHDAGNFQIQVVDITSKTVVISHKFDYKRTDSCSPSYELPQSDMTKLQPGSEYTVKVFSLGNNTSHLFSLVPTTSPEPSSYLKEVETLSASYDSNTDYLAITCSPSTEGTKSYHFYIAKPQSKSTPQEIVVAAFSFPAPKTSGDLLTFSKLVADFRENLSSADEYCLVARAFGKDSNIASKPKQAAKQWGMIQAPINVTHTYDPKYQNDTLTVNCDEEKNVSAYQFAIRSKQDSSIVSAVINTQKPSAIFKGAAIKADAGDKLECLARTATSNNNNFNSKWAQSHTTVEQLASPVDSEATFGSDVTNLTLTYPVIPNMESYYLQQITPDGKIHNFPGNVANIGDKSVVITLPVEGAAHFKIKSTIEVKATAIAKQNGGFLNSTTASYVSPPIERLDPPSQLSSKYNIKNGTISLHFSSVANSHLYSIQLVQVPSTAVGPITNIENTEYDYDIFSHVTSPNTYNFVVTAHSTEGENPVLPSTPTSLPPPKEWVVDNVITKLTIATSSSNSTSLQWDLCAKYKLANLVVSVLISQGSKTETVLLPKTGASSVGVNMTPGVKYTFKVFSKISHECIIGLPQHIEHIVSYCNECIQ